MSNELIGIVISVLLGGVGMFFNGSIKELINKFFSNLSKEQINILFIGLMVILFAFPNVLVSFFPAEDDGQAKVVNEYSEAEKTETEVYIDAGLEVIEIVGDGFEQKQINDSIKRVNKEQVWVYQIGLAKNNVDEVWSTYEIANKITSNVTVFKKSRKSYFVVKNDGLGKNELLDGLDSFKSEIDSVESIIKVVNLSTFCPLRKEISNGKKIKIKKLKAKIECLVCD